MSALTSTLDLPRVHTFWWAFFSHKKGTQDIADIINSHINDKLTLEQVGNDKKKLKRSRSKI